MPKKTFVCNKTNMICDSESEVNFIWWCLELIELGYIKSIDRSPTFNLSDRSDYVDTTGKKSQVKSLLRPHVYTPDFKINWDQKALNLFCCRINNVCIKNCHFIINDKDLTSYIEIKGVLNQSHDKTGSLSKFQVNRKWLFEKEDVYVDLIEPKSLFSQTFTPERYKKNFQGNRKRNIRFKTRTAKEFINLKLKFTTGKTLNLFENEGI